MKNIYGYVRVSTKKQGEGVSLEVQKRDIINFAQNKNLNVVGWFEEQKSASKGYRPQFNEMIEKLYNKEADGFIAHKIDRMMRNRHDWAIINELLDEGCEVISADGTTLDDVNGRFMGDIQAAVATRYSSNLAQEAKKGLYGRLAQGLYPFKAPVGYIDNGKGKTKTIDAEKAPLVKQLFDLYANKAYSVSMLIVEMHRLGLRNTRGNKFTKNGILKILKNPFYTGTIAIRGQIFKGTHQPILSMSTYRKAQEILKGKTNAKCIKHDFLFRRMIKCNECGYSLIGELQRGEVYYRCHTKECPTTSITQTEAENDIRRVICSISINDMEAFYMDKYLKIEKDNWHARRYELLRELNLKRGTLKSKQERITSLIIDGSIDAETFQSEKQKILTELQLLEEKEIELKDENLPILKEIAEYLELAKSPQILYEMGNTCEKQDVIKKVTSNLRIQGKNLLFTMLSPFYELANRHEFSFGAPNRDTPRIKETKLVLGDPDYEPRTPEPLDEAGCKRFIEYLIQSRTNNHN